MKLVSYDDKVLLYPDFEAYAEKAKIKLAGDQGLLRKLKAKAKA